MSYSWWALSLLPAFLDISSALLNSLAQCRPLRAWVVDWLLIPSVDELCWSLNCALGCINTHFIILWQSNNICPHRKAFWAFSAREQRQQELLVRSSQGVAERQHDCWINGGACDGVRLGPFLLCLLVACCFSGRENENSKSHICVARQDKTRDNTMQMEKNRVFIFWGGTNIFFRKQQKRWPLPLLPSDVVKSVETMALLRLDLRRPRPKVMQC